MERRVFSVGGEASLGHHLLSKADLDTLNDDIGAERRGFYQCVREVAARFPSLSSEFASLAGEARYQSHAGVFEELDLPEHQNASVEFCCWLLDQFINHDTAPWVIPCSIWQSWKLDTKTAIEACNDRSNNSEHESLFERFVRHHTGGKYVRDLGLGVLILNTAIRREKWKFVRAFLSADEPDSDQWLIATEWRHEVLSPSLKEQLCSILEMATSPIDDYEEQRYFHSFHDMIVHEEIMWSGFERRWGPEIPDSFRSFGCIYGSTYKPLEFQSLFSQVVGNSYFEMIHFHDFNWLCRGFAEESRYVSLCQVRGGTVDEWLEYLLCEYLFNLIDPNQGIISMYRLFLLMSWALLENFEKLQHKLFEKFLSKLCPDQNLAEIKEWTMKGTKQESLLLEVRD